MCYSVLYRRSRGIPKIHPLLLHWLYWSLWQCGSQQTVENSSYGIPDYITCLLRNLYAGQEATFTTGHRTTDCFKIGKWVHQGYILSPCLFNLYTEYIIQNAGLDDSQAGIKIAERNINNLRYADDTTLWLSPESEEELKSLLIKVKQASKKAGLKLNIHKTRIIASGPITLWQVGGEKLKTVTDFNFLEFQNHCRQWLQPWN